MRGHFSLLYAGIIWFNRSGARVVKIIFLHSFYAFKKSDQKPSILFKMTHKVHTTSIQNMNPSQTRWETLQFGGPYQHAPKDSCIKSFSTGSRVFREPFRQHTKYHSIYANYDTLTLPSGGGITPLKISVIDSFVAG